MVSCLVAKVALSVRISGGPGCAPCQSLTARFNVPATCPSRLATAYGHSTVPDLVLWFRCTGPLSDPCAGVVSPDR